MVLDNIRIWMGRQIMPDKEKRRLDAIIETNSKLQTQALKLCKQVGALLAENERLRVLVHSGGVDDQ